MVECGGRTAHYSLYWGGARCSPWLWVGRLPPRSPPLENCWPSAADLGSGLFGKPAVQSVFGACVAPLWLCCDNNPWGGSRARTRARTSFAFAGRVVVVVSSHPPRVSAAVIWRPPPALVVRCTERRGACRAVSRALARSRAKFFCSVVVVVGIFGHYFAAALERSDLHSLQLTAREMKLRVPFLLSGTGAEAHVERAN